MTPNHWEVVNFLREYYDEYQIAPAVRVLTKAIGKQLGPDKGNSKYLYELFPYGPAKQACKIAGLPKADRLRLNVRSRAAASARFGPPATDPTVGQRTPTVIAMFPSHSVLRRHGDAGRRRWRPDRASICARRRRC